MTHFTKQLTPLPLLITTYFAGHLVSISHWLLQCRPDYPVSVEELDAEREGRQFAGMWRTEVNHKFFKLRHKKVDTKYADKSDKSGEGGG